MTVPYWAPDAIFYQIFPDRFANGDTSLDPYNVQPWGSPPTIRGFQGGDLRGVIQKFDYLLDLGINAIYFNPIFLATSNHRYNTTDYLQIDTKLGNLSDFKALLNLSHRNNVRVILDGVFNHCGRGFYAFSDILENQAESPYRDWFTIKHWPVNPFTPDDQFSAEEADYVGWWNYKSLPKFNTNNRAVREYLFHVGRYWIEQGADGWRLDVPNEIDSDAFWAEFRKQVLAANSEALLIGEIWEVSPRWANNEHFDGLMNYPLREALLGFLQGKISAVSFNDRIQQLLTVYPRENVYAMYNLLGSHDTERILTVLKGDLNRYRLATLFQFAFPGMPAVYYGDEIGLTGGKDPESRKAFPWDESSWNLEIHAWIQKLIGLRTRLPVLRRGEYISVMIEDGRSCYGFARKLGDSVVLVLMNNSTTRRGVRVPIAKLGWQDGRIVHNMLGEGEFIVDGDTISLNIPPLSGMYLS